MAYAIITGASKGIGKYIAMELAKRKFNVLLVARSAEQLQTVATEIQTTYGVQADALPMDVTTPDAAAKLLQYCQQKNYAVSVLVNNAGYGLCGEFENYSLADNENMMHLNMNTVVQLIQTFLPMLKQQSQSYILNISGTIAYQALPGMSLYAGCKTFILSFSRGLKHELKNTSVSVSCLVPGAVDTDFVKRAHITPKALKAAQKVNMTPAQVAAIGVEGMLKGKAEIVAGFINKLSKFLVWLMPKNFVEKTAMKIYH